MNFMTSGAFDLGGDVEAPSRLEKSAMDYEKYSYTQHPEDNQ
jgi:hypothetical protein